VIAEVAAAVGGAVVALQCCAARSSTHSVLSSHHRKVAIPVPDSYSWDQFLDQVCREAGGGPGLESRHSVGGGAECAAASRAHHSAAMHRPPPPIPHRKRQVKARLRLTGVRDIYLASTGAKVRSVGELQDIDELCVVEVSAWAGGVALLRCMAVEACVRACMLL